MSPDVTGRIRRAAVSRLKGLRRRVTRLRGWTPYPAVETPTCEVCGSDDRVVVANRMHLDMAYQTVLCGDCGLVYISPRPDEEAFVHLYEVLMPDLYDSAPGPEWRETEPTPRGREVYAFLQDRTDLASCRGIFDVGCGGGGLLLAFADELEAGGLSGCALGGCDLSPKFGGYEIERAGRTIAVLHAAAESLGPELAAYSVFVLYDVVEHLVHPKAFLARLRDRTPPDARIFVSTSCLDNYELIPPAGWEAYYLRLVHPYTFTRYSLELMLAAAGWQVDAWAQGAKGDQWVLASKQRPLPVRPDPRRALETLEFIERYKERCR